MHGPDEQTSPEQTSPAGTHRFVEGFVASSLVFCVGPLTVLGSLSDGMGRGSDQLVLKAVLDGFASIAFAASLGWGVAASALVVLVVQGSLTALGAVLGSFVPEPHLLALTATGGLLLAGVSIRLLRIRAVPVGDLLPALVVLGFGLDPTRALVLSQVVLSFGIPFALVPLVLLTRRRDVMGGLVNRPATTLAAAAVAGLIIALNLLLIGLTVSGA